MWQENTIMTDQKILLVVQVVLLGIVFLYLIWLTQEMLWLERTLIKILLEYDIKSLSCMIYN